MITPIGQKIEYDIKTYRNHRKEKPDASTKIKVAAGTLAGNFNSYDIYCQKAKCQTI